MTKQERKEVDAIARECIEACKDEGFPLHEADMMLEDKLIDKFGDITGIDIKTIINEA